MGLFDIFKFKRAITPQSFLGGNWEEIFKPLTSGVSITIKNSMSIAGIYSAVRIYADTISSLPLHLMQDDGNNKVKVPKHPLSTIIRSPNKLMTSFVFWEIMLPHMLLWGNAYAVIEFNNMARPTSLIPVHPSNVKVSINEGILWYEITIGSQQPILVDQSNMLHLRGLGDNLVGLSVIEQARENLGLGKAAEQFGSTFFGNGSNMNGVLQTDKQLSDKAYKNLKESINSNNGGINNSNKMLILEEGLTFNTTSIPPNSAQFLETRKFSINDIARWFKLPLHMLGDLERATFSNIEQQDLNFVKHSILPYVINIEQELNRKLLRESEKKNMYFKMNLEGLLRGDIKTRSEAYRTFINNGIMSPNEARKKEQLDPYKGGDSRYMPLNLSPIQEDGSNQIINENNGTDNK